MKEVNAMKLSAGERYSLTDEKSYIVLTSGKAEVYAVTQQQDSFRQMFLTELAPGEAAFPSLDEFGMVDVVIYAVEDAELDLSPLADGEPASLAPMMRQWCRFFSCAKETSSEESIFTLQAWQMKSAAALSVIL